MILLQEYYDSPSSLYLREENEKKGIKYVSMIAGSCCILYVFLQNFLWMGILLTPIGEICQIDPTMDSVVSVFMSILTLLVPFGIGGVLISKKTKKSVFAFNKPVDSKLMIFAVPLGFFICLAANYVTSVFVNWMDFAGIHLTSPDYDVPDDIGGRLIYTVSIAVVPALVEEFCIRGVVMQPLRKYGDKFAIIASSLLFAVLHGNLVQAPFALIAGFGLGYAVCITDSVWTGVLIHFFNNLYSVAVEFMIADIKNENVLNSVYLLTTVILYAVSILGSVIFVFVKNKRKLVPSFTVLSEKRKMRAFVLTVPMVLAVLMMIRITLNYVSFG